MTVITVGPTSYTYLVTAILVTVTVITVGPTSYTYLVTAILVTVTVITSNKGCFTAFHDLSAKELYLFGDCHTCHSDSDNCGAKTRLTYCGMTLS